MSITVVLTGLFCIQLFDKIFKMANKILVISLDKKFRKFEQRTKKTGIEILKILKKKNAEVEIYLAGNRQMKALNKKFRKKDKPANILSFNEPKGFVYPKSSGRGNKKIGEIYLNTETKDEMFSKKTLLAHGILHLFGYNHKTKKEANKMEAVEQKIFRQIRNTKH